MRQDKARTTTRLSGQDKQILGAGHQRRVFARGSGGSARVSHACSAFVAGSARDVEWAFGIFECIKRDGFLVGSSTYACVIDCPPWA